MKIGDEIIAINSIRVNTLKYEDIMKLLITTDQPVKFDLNGQQEHKQKQEKTLNKIELNEHKIEIGKETMVEIKKSKDSKNLGISIIGGIDTNLNGIFIHDIHENEAVYNDGRLEIGDELIKINDAILTNKTYNEALSLLRSEMIDANKESIKLSILRHFNKEYENNNEDFYKSKYDIKEIELNKKYGNGLGISIIGKKDGKGGAYVSHIIKGGLADKNGQIMIGDYILSVNNRQLFNSSYDDIIFYLKTLSPGKITIKIARIKTSISSSNMSIHSSALGSSINDQNKLRKSKSTTINGNDNDLISNSNTNKNKFNRKSLINRSLPNILKLNRQKSLPNINKSNI